MVIDADTLKAFVEGELARVADTRVTSHIRSLLIEPKPVLRDWDYGEEGQQYVCWMVLKAPAFGTGIAYCEDGFGPRAPWGLIWLDGAQVSSMGMDSSWYATFLQAFMESGPATVLPIWRVFRTDSHGVCRPITPEGGWDETWRLVYERRRDDPGSRYDCDADVAIEHR